MFAFELNWNRIALFNELLKKPSQQREVSEKPMKGLAMHGENVQTGTTPYSSRPRRIAHERHLPKTLSRATTSERDLPLPEFFLHHLNFAVNDYIEAVASVPLAEDDLAGFKVFAADAA